MAVHSCLGLVVSLSISVLARGVCPVVDLCALMFVLMAGQGVCRTAACFVEARALVNPCETISVRMAGVVVDLMKVLVGFEPVNHGFVMHSQY